MAAIIKRGNRSLPEPPYPPDTQPPGPCPTAMFMRAAGYPKGFVDACASDVHAMVFERGLRGIAFVAAINALLAAWECKQ